MDERWQLQQIVPIRSRWSESEIDELKAEMNRRHLLDPIYMVIADALGSLQFDLVDAKR